jgi:hypothetical protein
MPDPTAPPISGAAPGGGAGSSAQAAAISSDGASPPTTDQVLAQLTQAVLAQSGVTRLVPSLKDALRRLKPQHGTSPGSLLSNQPRPGDGITLAVNDQAATATLEVSISISSDANARTTAVAVQSAALTVLTISYPEAATHQVRVNVLALEPD